MADQQQPEIKIKFVKKKGGHAAAHGGAWKVAYADLVTAMVAFFLLMWLLSSADKNMYMNNYVGQTVTVAGDSMQSKAGLKTVASGENAVAVKGHLRAMDLAVDSETYQK